MPKTTKIKAQRCKDAKPTSLEEAEHWGYYELLCEIVAPDWSQAVQASVGQKSETVKAGKYAVPVVVSLNKNGKLLGTSVGKPSGVRELDEAAVKVWDNGVTFPPPPAALLNAKGIAQVNWTFRAQVITK